mgnify:CR=1 FL=1
MPALPLYKAIDSLGIPIPGTTRYRAAARVAVAERSGTLEPLTWARTTTAYGADTAEFVCPAGHRAALTNRPWWGETPPHSNDSPPEGAYSGKRVFNSIASNGEVEPAVDCPDASCGFLEYITLTGWS